MRSEKCCAGFYFYVMSCSVDFIYSHGEVFNWGKDMRTSVLQGEDSVGRRRWKDWSGDSRTKASGGGGGIQTKR